MQVFVRFIKCTPLYSVLRLAFLKRSQQKELIDWERRGKTGCSPHLIKQRALLEYARCYGLNILVETGTYLGDMVEAMKSHFKQVYSIELSKDLHALAVKRFRSDVHVEILQGDSGTELGNLMSRINEPVLFWLDGHYSGGITAKGNKDCPIFEELGHILKGTELNHVIIIDDARYFGTDPAYPTADELKMFVKSRWPDVDFEVKDDSIRITPKCRRMVYDAGLLGNN